MVNTERVEKFHAVIAYYNILNIVVNTEHNCPNQARFYYYNILNIVVNTEPPYKKTYVI